LKRALTDKNNYYIVKTMNAQIGKNNIMAVFYQRAKRKGLKITPQRTAIYEELLKAKDHPSADTIYKRIVKRYRIYHLTQ
jgi:Fe2+ or Zn2+ uptake regulation protein